MTRPEPAIAAATIEQAIAMLERYVASAQLPALIAVLRVLPEQPFDDALRDRLTAALDNLGVLQGAVLTYAPVIGGLLSDHPFDSRDARPPH